MYTRLSLCITALFILLPTQSVSAFFSQSDSEMGSFAAATVEIVVIPPAHSSGVSDVFSPYFGFAIQNSGSHNPQYRLTASTTNDTCDFSDFYDALNVTVNGPNGLSYSGPLNSMELFGDFNGVWNMNIDTDNAFSAYVGETCIFSLTVEAWQQSLTYGNGGFTDTKNITFTLTSLDTIGKQDTANIVLNELYPNQLATSTVLLDQEWVELYNGTDTVVDVEGWSLGERTSGNGVETRHMISSSNTCSSGSKVGYARPYGGVSTSIAPGELLIIEFCASARMFNGGDIIALYDEASTTVDSHTYPSTTAGKSHARIPDGATWVDPIPSPGVTNMETITVQDLTDAGWNNILIEKVLGADSRSIFEFASEKENFSGPFSSNIISSTSSSSIDVVYASSTSGEKFDAKKFVATSTNASTTIANDVSSSTHVTIPILSVPEFEESIATSSDEGVPDYQQEVLPEMIEPKVVSVSVVTVEEKQSEESATKEVDEISEEESEFEPILDTESVIAYDESSV